VDKQMAELEVAALPTGFRADQDLGSRTAPEVIDRRFLLLDRKLAVELVSRPPLREYLYEQVLGFTELGEDQDLLVRRVVEQRFQVCQEHLGLGVEIDAL